MEYSRVVKSLAEIPLSSLTQKSAGQEYGTLGHVLTDRFLGVGVPSLAVGASAAVVMKVLSDLRQNTLDAKGRKAKESDENTFQVVLPAPKLAEMKPQFLPWQVAGQLIEGQDKQAGGVAAPNHWAGSLPADAIMAVAPAVIAYKVLDHAFKRQEKKEIEESIKGIKDDYSSLLVRDIQRQQAAMGKTAEFPGWDPVECLIEGLVELKQAESQEDHDACAKTAATKPGAGYQLYYFEGRRGGISAKSEEEARQKKNVVAGTRLQKVGWATDTLSAVTGMPFLLALLAGAASHRYALNKERDVDEYYNRVGKKTVKPPTHVKLVMAPPAEAGATAGQEEKAQQLQKKAEGFQANDSHTKTAFSTGTGLLGVRLFELAGNSPTGIKAELAARESQDLIDQQAQEQQLARTTPVDHVDSNTLVLNTPSGQVIIDASDPGSMEYLNNNTEALMDSLNSVNATA
jgi:hypothetical protein